MERDVRAITAVKDLATFRRLLTLVASRHGQMLNKTDLAAPLGISVPTVSQWLGILETTEQILIIPPFYENLGKRLVKSPKILLADSGLACHLLGIRTAAELSKSPYSGAIFEGFMASEIIKAQVNSGQRRGLYYFRDEQGLEVDFLLSGHSKPTLVECKAGKTVTASMARALIRLSEAWIKQKPKEKAPRMVMVHQPPRDDPGIRTLAPGVQAMPWREFIETLKV